MHSDAHCREVIDQNRLKAFFPHPFLEKHFSDLASENRRKRVLASEAGTHNLPHFHLMKETILAAVTGLNDSLKPCHTLVLGAKECNDLPLETLAGMGPVYLIDVDMKSMETARQRLAPPSLRDTVHLVSMDVSLFVSSLLEKAHDLLQQYADDIAGAWQAIVDMHNEITQRDQPLFEKKGLPIRNRQADLALSTMTLSQFVTGYLNLLVNHFLMIYGRQQVKDHFLEGQKVDELVDSSLPLALGAAEAHIRELGRIVHTEGLIVFADHALHGQGVFISKQYMELDVGSLISYSKNKNEDKYLQLPELLDRRNVDSLFR